MDDAARESDRTFQTVSSAVGVVSFVVFTYLGHLIAGNIVLGAIAGGLVGAGSHIAYPMLLRAEQTDDRSLRDIDEPTWTGLRRFPTGAALLTAGAGTIMGMFAFPGRPVLPVAVGIGIVEYAFFSFLYGRSD